MSDGERIIPINIEEEMKTAYIDYSMSVIVSRAIPDVRDGLKPVHRRVLFGMHDLGVNYNKPYKKSARIVGEVLGKYHPHGDTSVYDAMVRMAQDWSMRYPLVDGQGNFGSVDGDSPAAMRYTEARFQRITEDIISDLEKDTVDFTNNFDDTLKEPSVMPSRIPNLLVNGSSGIAVGMATNMLPHNLTEICNGIIAFIKNREITTLELMEYVKGPDFPTGGQIYGVDGILESFETGRGRIVVRGIAEIESLANNREQIIITEIPFQVNKSVLITKMAELVNEKKIEGISDIRDESNREGFRIVIELKRDGVAAVILNQLYKYTQLQSSYGVNNICLVNGRPKLLGLKQIIEQFVLFRHEVVVRRTQFELRKAEERAHILEGLMIALDHLDEVIALIRGSKTPDDAREGLISKFGLSEIQAKAILEMRLQRLTGLERDKIKLEYEEVMAQIKRLKEILDNEDIRMQIIVDEVNEVLERFGDKRRTSITAAEGELSIADLINEEDVVITISHMGYIKRTAATEYRRQGRGGTGFKGSETRDEDFIEHIFIASTHDTMLFFTQQGKCFWLPVYQIPEGSRTSKGRAMQNLINLPPGDKVMATIDIHDLKDEEFINSHYLIFCTKKGVIKKTTVEAFSRPRTNGIIAINIKDEDQLLEVKLTNGKLDIMMAVKSGRAIRFPEGKVRPMGRNSTGVRGIRLANEADEVVGMICVDKENMDTTVLVVSEKGYGKRTNLVDPEDGGDVYRVTNRGGKGVSTIKITEKTGKLIALKAVTDQNDLIIITENGIAIRMGVDSLRKMGRATQGVRLISLKGTDQIASVTRIDREEEVVINDEEIPGTEEEQTNEE
ncbi:MAG: DNA gyrase subunit A [Bacteroidetes bacterium]|nr:DNA gyrase subunit A [Bacteroidota bacterium]MBP7398082.1 DNA gyrase subunit A [Chitinophagales bacterium]MBK8487939.1 DNA gyrase subunit A [Bacteroidota bacterium]MBP8753160.1 DNA gyrase subunit A [Chitinophagales bacterium]MBP9188152.1 DNA gyrase subunit A [Chitinophagales bacterium]